MKNPDVNSASSACYLARVLGSYIRHIYKVYWQDSPCRNCKYQININLIELFTVNKNNLVGLIMKRASSVWNP